MTTNDAQSAPISRLSRAALALCLVLIPVCSSAAAEVDSLVAKLKSLGREAATSNERSRLWRELVQLSPQQLPAMLKALDGTDAVTANWLQTAIDAVCEKALGRQQALPQSELEAIVGNTRHAGRARRLAYEWVVRCDATAPERLLPGMLQDPDVDLRRDAVARVVAEAEQYLGKGDKTQATALFQKAFPSACDRDQVDQIAKQLKALGVEVNLTEHFGFVCDWLLVGPFDNSTGDGYRTALPPEAGVDWAATYRGKQNAKVRWTPFSTADVYGNVDLLKGVGSHKGAVAYAFAIGNSPREQPINVRVGSDMAIKVFLNGKLIFAHEDYHVGTRMDKYAARGVLRQGPNEILLKVCQNEGGAAWKEAWGFQLRVCDELGGPVPFKLVTPQPSPKEAEGKPKP